MSLVNLPDLPSPAAARKRSFAPVVDAAVRVLVLGSLPGDASLARGQYYGHPQNRFWHLMGAVVGVDLPPLDYAARLAALLAAHVGLWDVIAEARRAGSLDGNIRDRANNDLVSLLATLPHLHTIAFNGGTAARIGMKALQQQAGRYRIVSLPSSSPAYTLAYSEKLAAWLALRDEALGTSAGRDS
ncbi:DNA-deoxyinosine glycosylase [Massilia sp. PWRC2]|uniref:DNA-deoxyinosine glycosylase n=1 Tax=Massilia sp. PWRC2 TaxID=2804626 RepID=UPI003CFA969D